MIHFAPYSGTVMIAGFFMNIFSTGLLQNTLAALGYVLVALSPQQSIQQTLPVVTNPLERYEYEVKTGDTMTDIAAKFYDSHDHWTTLWNDNPHVINPSVLEVGTKLSVRTEKPLLVEYVAEERMMAALTNPKNEKLDPSLALAVAGTPSPTVTKVLAQVLPTTEPKVQAAVEKAPDFPQSNNFKPSNFDHVYQQAGDLYGVPWQILYGLHLTETGLRDGEIYNGQGSGAQGPMQFMPGTWRAYGVDGNGDGVADINNAVDAIHGAANYLVKHGGVHEGLRYYGGNTSGVLSAARSRGYVD